MTHELNLVGLPGPTHNFGGLAVGNLASDKHRFETSKPRLAAFQALDEMKLLHALGVPVAVMPPHPRPNLEVLRNVGFSGNDAEILENARKSAPELFFGAFSSSAMWTANAATVSPAHDCADGRVHLTPANLVSQFHRSIEPEWTTRLLRQIFADERWFCVHEPLPANAALRDEGAANHLRLNSGDATLEIFVFGSDAAKKFPARQTLAASQAVARLHGLAPAETLFLEQNPAAIDAGVFHNDVISVSGGHVLLHHVDAFADPAAIDRIRAAFPDLCAICVDSKELTVAETVETYLFNSLLLALPAGCMALVAPEECREHQRAKAAIERILAGENPIVEAHFLPLRESMKNGGGPACLRLRVPADSDALGAAHPGVRYDETLDAKLRAWVQANYREELGIGDLIDPALIDESRRAWNELLTLLGLGCV